MRKTYCAQPQICICAWCTDNRCNKYWQAPESMHAYWHGHGNPLRILLSMSDGHVTRSVSKLMLTLKVFATGHCVAWWTDTKIGWFDVTMDQTFAMHFLQCSQHWQTCNTLQVVSQGQPFAFTLTRNHAEASLIVHWLCIPVYSLA